MKKSEKLIEVARTKRVTAQIKCKAPSGRACILQFVHPINLNPEFANCEPEVGIDDHWVTIESKTEIVTVPKSNIAAMIQAKK